MRLDINSQIRAPEYDPDLLTTTEQKDSVQPPNNQRLSPFNQATTYFKAECLEEPGRPSL